MASSRKIPKWFASQSDRVVIFLVISIWVWSHGSQCREQLRWSGTCLVYDARHATYWCWVNSFPLKGRIPYNLFVVIIILSTSACPGLRCHSFQFEAFVVANKALLKFHFCWEKGYNLSWHSICSSCFPVSRSMILYPMNSSTEVKFMSDLLINFESAISFAPKSRTCLYFTLIPVPYSANFASPCPTIVPFPAH